jgi:small subunit ribosomal protein S10e
MLIPKKNLIAIYEQLFRDGVMVAKKDFNAPKHPEIDTVPNLQVIKAMQVSKRSSLFLKDVNTICLLS